MRAAFLKTVEKKKSEIAESRKNGAKGGQGTKKQERYNTLNNLAVNNLSRFQYVSDIQARRAAKQLAGEHDKGAVNPLFQQSGQLMSDAWFDEWLTHFRTLLQCTENNR